MGYRISEVKLKNYGVIGDFSSTQFANINLIIGGNGAGKTFLLKALYSAVKALEEYRRGDDIRTVNDIISEKLRWTFQVERLGDMVTRSADDHLNCIIRLGNEKIEYQFSHNASSKVGNAVASKHGKAGNSIFIPAKEVFSLFPVILRSREVDKSFGFDDTYYDLAKAIQFSPSPNVNSTEFANARKVVSDMIDGKIDYDEGTGKWFYWNRKNQKFSIGATSDGVKKIATMDRLLANGYLDSSSIIFVDEIESALHPKAICHYLDLIDTIANQEGLQVFISSNSYFVIKKLCLIARRAKDLVNCISLDKKQIAVYDLHDGMSENSIINTSMRLYEQETKKVL